MQELLNRIHAQEAKLCAPVYGSQKVKLVCFGHDMEQLKMSYPEAAMALATADALDTSKCFIRVSVPCSHTQAATQCRRDSS